MKQLKAAAIVLQPAHIMLFFYAVTAAIIAAGVAREVFVSVVGTDTVLQDLRHFALDAERNLGAWYSSALMALISVCTYLNWRQNLLQEPSEGGGLARHGWLFIAIVFVGLSLDETVGFHETVDLPLRETFGLTGLLYNPWVLLGAGFVAAFVVVLIPFMLTLPRHIAALFVMAGAVYVVGALGMEPLDAYFEHRDGVGSLFQIVSTTVEEALEMIGLTLFLRANLLFMANSGFWFSLAPGDRTALPAHKPVSKIRASLSGFRMM